MTYLGNDEDIREDNCCIEWETSQGLKPGNRKYALQRPVVLATISSFVLLSLKYLPVQTQQNKYYSFNYEEIETILPIPVG